MAKIIPFSEVDRRRQKAERERLVLDAADHVAKVHPDSLIEFATTMLHVAGKPENRGKRQTTGRLYALLCAHGALYRALATNNPEEQGW